MSTTAGQNNAHPLDDQTVAIVNEGGKGPFLLVCEHASNAIPSQFDGLGLSKEVQQSHIAWDPGACDVALLMSKLLDAPLIIQNVSRLIYDCNRPPTVLSSIPATSEIYDVPGNQNLTDAERERRVKDYYEPFSKMVASEIQKLRARAKAPLFITIHSFTPTYFGEKRTVELGILHDADARLANVMLGSLNAHSKLKLGENEPYGPKDGVTHTLLTHAIPNNLHNVMIEIRNDLIATDKDQEKIAKLLCDAAEDAAYLFQQQWSA